MWWCSECGDGVVSVVMVYECGGAVSVVVCLKVKLNQFLYSFIV